MIPAGIQAQVVEAVAQAESDGAGRAFAACLSVDFDFDPPIAFNRKFAQHLPGDLPDCLTSLTRARILDGAENLNADSSDAALVSFLYLVNAWGYGRTGYGYSRTARVAGADFIPAARRALELLQDPADDLAPVAAYFHLRNEGHVHGWGPAFFTKFLMFADPANATGSSLTRTRAVVLDRLTAARTNDFLSAPFRQRRPRQNARLGRFGASGWNTVQYAYYLALVRTLAEDERFERNAMNVERILFAEQREVEGSERRRSQSIEDTDD